MTSINSPPVSELVAFVLTSYAVWSVWLYGSIFQNVRDALESKQTVLLVEKETNKLSLYNSIRLFFFSAWLCPLCLSVHVPAYLYVIIYGGVSWLAGCNKLATVIVWSLAATGFISLTLNVRKTT